MVNLDSVGRLRDGRLYVMRRRQRHGPPRGGEEAAQGLLCSLSFGRRRRSVGPHVVLNRGRPVAVPLHGPARRLSPAERHVGQDRRGRARHGRDARRPGCVATSAGTIGGRRRVKGGAPRVGRRARRLRPVLRRGARLRGRAPGRGSARWRPAWQPCGPRRAQERGRHRAVRRGDHPDARRSRVRPPEPPRRRRRRGRLRPRRGERAAQATLEERR